MKTKNGARLGYNLNAGTGTNNNLYEEMEKPQGLGSKANLSCEKGMKLSNGHISQGFFVVFLILPLKKIIKKERRSTKLCDTQERLACD